MQMLRGSGEEMSREFVALGFSLPSSGYGTHVRVAMANLQEGDISLCLSLSLSSKYTGSK